MDSESAARRLGESGVSSVQFVLASSLALVLFLLMANLVVVQYGRGAIRSALEQGARAGTVAGIGACQRTAESVVQDLLGGRMSDGLTISCVADGSDFVASSRAVFESWIPLTPDFEVSLTSRAVGEP